MFAQPQETRRKAVCDIETRSLTDHFTHVVCYYDLEEKQLYSYIRDEYYDEYVEELEKECQGKIEKLSKFVKRYHKQNPVLIGHNFLQFDRIPLEGVLGLDKPIFWKDIEDTLVMSRLINPSFKGFSHALGAWGERLGYPKLHFDDFENFSVKMVKYCEVDVLLNVQLYEKLQPLIGKRNLEKAYRIESEFAYNIREQKRTGFKFDVPFATQVRAEMNTFLDKLQTEIRKDYPAKATLVNKQKPIIPLKFKKNGEKSIVNLKKFMKETGTDLNQIDGDFCFIEWEEFNLASPAQVVERLDEAGWRPIEFNKPSPTAIKRGEKKGSPKVSETNLDTLPEDAPQSAKNLAVWRKVFVRRNMVNQWLDAAEETGRVHGDVNPIGSWSQRCSHSNPNTANIASASFGPDGPLIGRDGFWGWDSRRMWRAESKCDIPEDKPMGYHGDFDTPESVKKFLDTYRKYGRVIIGCDAEGIQLRALAHYMGDTDYINAVADGDKKLKTDVHNVNLKLSKGILKSRDDAKTFIYAFLLGAGLFKLGVIAGAPVGKEPMVGKKLKTTFLRELPALANLKRKSSHYVEKGWFKGLDGRRVPVPSNHLFLTALLQSFEAIIMKEFYNKVCAYIRAKGLDANIVAFVHDEVQIDCSVEDAPTLAKALPVIMTKVGESLGCRIRIDGNSQVGLSWADSH